MIAPSTKLQRSQLAVPATSDRFIAKAAACAADAIFLDLEDSVIPDLKIEARERAIAAINGHDWGDKIVSVRVNALETKWGCRDIIEIAEACPRLDRILLPKCDTASHVAAADLILRGVEAGLPDGRQIGLEAIIETAKGLVNVEAIAASTGRLRALIFGAGDFQLDMRIFMRSVGAPSAKYIVLTDMGDAPRQRHWNDPWHFALVRISAACRANGILPIDGAFTNIADPEGYRSAAERAASLGYEGKWNIHPSQIDVANEIFSPSAEQIAWAEEVMATIAAAAEHGRGSAKNKDGEMVDMAHLKMAHMMLERSILVAGANPKLRADGEQNLKGSR